MDMFSVMFENLLEYDVVSFWVLIIDNISSGKDLIIDSKL